MRQIALVRGSTIIQGLISRLYNLDFGLKLSMIEFLLWLCHPYGPFYSLRSSKLTYWLLSTQLKTNDEEVFALRAS